MLEGWYDNEEKWHAGDLEQRLAAVGVRRNRESVPVDELPHLSENDKYAREIIDAYLSLRQEAGISISAAVAEFVRETAYTWANRLLALRCMEARELIDEVIIQKDIYGGRSLEHHRLAQRQPGLCTGEDDGLFAVLDKVFAERAETLPLLFNPRSPGVALKPSAAVLKKCIALISGTETVNSRDAAPEDLLKAPDALGWAYQYWNSEEKDRVFEKVRTNKRAKIEGSDIIPATQLYTEPYMVKFLVQNSLGASWVGMHPDTKLIDNWEYFVRDADRAPVKKKPVKEITFLDPACGSGHFLLEAFDLFYSMYEEEGELTEPDDICHSILENNLYGIDIDERAVQISEAALWMKAAEKAFNFAGAAINLISTNIHLPKGKDHLKAFLSKHPDDVFLLPALETIFEGLEHVDELGALIQIEEPVEEKLEAVRKMPGEQRTLFGPKLDKDWQEWKKDLITRLKEHFANEAESSNLAEAYFGHSVSKGLALFDILSRRYEVVAANPPYMGLRQMGEVIERYLRNHYAEYNDDLYATFINRCAALTKSDHLTALVIQQGFFFTTTYIAGRADFWSKCRLEFFLHIGPGGFIEISGEVVNTALIAFRRKPPLPFSISNFIDIRGKENKSVEVKKACAKGPNFMRSYDWLRRFPKQRLCYWFSDNVVSLFEKYRPADFVMDVRQGLATSENNRFIRRWWECPGNNRWNGIIMSEGVERWLAENNRVVEWDNNGARLRSFIIEKCGSVSKRIYSEDFYFRPGVTFGRRTAGALAVRYVPEGFIFDNSAPCAFPYNTMSVLAFLNSKLCAFVADGLNPTSSFQVGDMKDIPIIDEGDNILDEFAQRCVEARNALLSLRPTARDFDLKKRHLKNRCDLTSYLNDRLDSIEKTESYLSECEHRVDERVFDIANIGHSSRNVIKLYFQNNCGGGRVNPSDVMIDDIMIYILCLLGHRWPKQIEDIEPIPEWADVDGIIPLTEGTNEQTLSERVRERIAAEFKGGNVASIEREFAEIMGKPLSQWLETEFFKHHVKQFKKRPIAWQIQSGKFTRNIKPAFACLVYYHKIDGDILAKIRTQYVALLRQRYETELRGIESVSIDSRSDHQDQRRVELERLIEELKDFETKLQKVAAEAFASEKLNTLIADEKPDKWCSIDGSKEPPKDKETFLRQERSYFPDINDGVRVNIAPLQKAGLLAADVLAKKDAAKAIDDRAEWRSDERRWCREGKLPKPGWWRQETEDN
ncbi:MAG: BREX-1 system adenine-specific DNA-methyltransferase PglX [Candidatus Aminicenantes bacterium]|nr:BREX-1 system adenine-specific DNA-methyltransferase PglX [Candidatus Aminicenantes bacterium]NIQ67445.1 BREX-1 system adenine-specific DNA-methyltransferase PglX [Candidatus Aminicenantes bacterium]NIR07436.1 BREX-1 system adenine-specific DNA-methyltransferase PglX [Candidatus Aminicenantes bacterium]NIT23479.1 BREX-1 system adenine-specific DNA-methyltransferase PglX [Candidatus Aminicenantes bacterium]